MPRCWGGCTHMLADNTCSSLLAAYMQSVCGCSFFVSVCLAGPSLPSLPPPSARPSLPPPSARPSLPPPSPRPGPRPSPPSQLPPRPSVRLLSPSPPWLLSPSPPWTMLRRSSRCRSLVRVRNRSSRRACVAMTFASCAACIRNSTFATTTRSAGGRPSLV